MQIINPTQNAILGLFGHVSDSDQFYLTGGTALAQFYLGHRKSNDLDFFTPTEEIVPAFSFRLEEHLKTKGFLVERKRGIHSFVELWVGKAGETTLIHLAQDAAFRFESPKEFPEFPGLRVDSLKDIASNKLLALFGRAALRDFVDVYYLVRETGFSQDDLIKMAQNKDPGFDLYWLGIAFERIKTFRSESPDLLLLKESLPFSDLLNFFDKWRRDISGKIEP